jgi:hypothetical protein
MDNLQRYEPKWDEDVYRASNGSLLYVDELLDWIEEHRPQIGDAQALLKLIEELRKNG